MLCNMVFAETFLANAGRSCVSVNSAIAGRSDSLMVIAVNWYTTYHNPWTLLKFNRTMLSMWINVSLRFNNYLKYWIQRAAIKYTTWMKQASLLTVVCFDCVEGCSSRKMGNFCHQLAQLQIPLHDRCFSLYCCRWRTFDTRRSREGWQEPQLTSLISVRYATVSLFSPAVCF